MIKYQKTRLHFDAADLQKAVARLSAGNWKEHYNKAHYEGDWSILPLRAIGGSIDNVISVQAAAGMQYRDTALLQQCPELQAVLDGLACETTAVRLMKLKAGALIKEHTDHDMHMEAGEARLHIPVQTNPDVAFYIQEERIPMAEGECWYLNLSLPHRVHNAGTTDRIHLVVDCLVNDWVKELLNGDASFRKEIDALPVSGKFSAADKQRIIAELKQLNTPAALQQARILEEA